MTHNARGASPVFRTALERRRAQERHESYKARSEWRAKMLDDGWRFLRSGMSPMGWADRKRMAQALRGES